MSAFYAVNHWIHILSAVAAIGATMTARMAVHPALRDLEIDDETRAKVERAIRARVGKIVSMSLMLLLVTGFVNLARVFQLDTPGAYLPLLLLKIVLALVVFAIAICALVPSEALAEFQKKRPLWMLVNVILGTIVIFLSAWIGILRAG